MEALRNIIILLSVVNVSPKSIPDSPAAIAVKVSLCTHYKNYARIKYSKDCNFFYECHGGLTYLLKCPEHSWFDHNLKKCVFDETVCHMAAEDKEEESEYTDGNKITSDIVKRFNYKKHIVNNANNNDDQDHRQVSLVYKYICTTEKSPRMSEEYRRRSVRNLSRLTLEDVDVGKHDEENIISDTEDDDTSSEYSSDYMTSTIIWMDQTTKKYPYGLEKRSTGSVQEEDEVKNTDYEEERNIKRNYRLQLQRFSKRLQNRAYSDKTNNDKNDENRPELTTQIEEDTESEEMLDWESATRPPLKKIKISNYERTRILIKKPEDSIKYVNFGSYTAPHPPIPYKILGEYFQPYEFTKKLVKRSHLNNSDSSTNIRNINNITHSIEKRDGIYITLNLKDFKKKTNIAQQHKYSTYTSLLDSTTNNMNSLEFLKIFNPDINNESSTSFEDHTMSEIDLLIQLYKWKESSRELKLNNKDNAAAQNVNLDKLMAKTDKTRKLFAG